MAHLTQDEDLKTAPPLGPVPEVILVRPQMGENIGGAARAMLNFGLDRMRIIAPRDGWPNPSAVAMASGAGRVLDGAAVFDNLSDGIADCDYVYATTARTRDLAKPILSPEQAMKEARALQIKGKKVAILFGPERTGLENYEIAPANALISVPVNPEFASLNLAQCVLLSAYEWRRQSTEIDASLMEWAGSERAVAIEVEKLAEHYEDRLQEAGFFYPETKAPVMKTALRNMWSRMPMSRADVQIFHGILRQLLRNLPKNK